MPYSNTFSIKPIKELIEKYAIGKIVDPFANSNKFAEITNDLNPEFDTTYHLDALDFFLSLPELILMLLSVYYSYFLALF